MFGKTNWEKFEVWRGKEGDKNVGEGLGRESCRRAIRPSNMGKEDALCTRSCF